MEGLDFRYFASLDQGSDEWLAARQKCDFGSSELGAALGISSFKSRYGLFREKNGEKVNLPTSFFMQLGITNEPLVVDAVRPMYKPNELVPFGMAQIICDEFVLGVSPDRLVVTPAGAWVGLVEVKCHARFHEGVRIEHVPQLLAQTVAFQVPVVHYVVQILEEGDQPPVVYEVTFDPRLWSEVIRPEIVAAKKRMLAKDYSRVDSRDRDRIKAAIVKYTKAKLLFDQSKTPEQVQSHKVTFY